MTEQLLKDRVWRRKNRLCTFLSLIPVFGWAGFWFMGKRSGRKNYQVAAGIYGILCVVMLLLLGLDSFYYDFFGTYRSVIVLRETAGFCRILLPIVWVACLIHTLALSNQYLQFLALRQSVSPERDPLTADKKWRLENLFWIIWSCMPLLGGFSTWTVGCRLKKRGASLLALLPMLAAVIIWLMDRLNYYFDIGTINPSLELMFFCTAVFWVINLIVCFLYREDYLDLRAVEWKKDTRALPKQRERAWRLRNSLWQIWTLFPYVGGIGISIAGVRGKNRRFTVVGAVFSLIAALLFAISVAGDSILLTLGVDTNYDNRHFLQDMASGFTFILYLLVLYYGTAIRWDVLRGRANALQGYGSEFERELDIQNRLRARGMDIPVVAPQSKDEEPKSQIPEPAPEMPQSTPEPVHHRPLDTPAEPASQQTPDEKIDINHCTQSELMALPGIGIAQAKRAMEHRQTQGGFQSVDEFVELLQIKPHFAVQIFARANVGQEEAPAQKPDVGQPAVRRQIDF